jgi:hypothetical protein
LVVRSQYQVAAGLADLPVLMLNSTARIEDVRRFGQAPLITPKLADRIL